MAVSELTPVLLAIIAAVAVFAAVIVPITAIAKADNVRRLELLMNAHESNLRSGDPAKVAESIERWKTMCRYIQKSNQRLAMLGRDLERWGDQAAIEATLSTEAILVSRMIGEMPVRLWTKDGPEPL